MPYLAPVQVAARGSGERTATPPPVSALRAVAMAYRVFVSYSTHDLAIAAQVQQWLRAVGAEVFVAEYSLDPGADLKHDILRKIHACDLFVLLWSEHAEASEWVAQEIGAAQGQGKPTIPVALDTTKVPGFLRGTKYLPAFKDLPEALRWLQRNVAGRVKGKQQAAKVMVGIGGVLLLLAALDKDQTA